MKKLFLLNVIFFTIISCNKNNENENENLNVNQEKINENVKSERNKVIENISDDEMIHNIIFQKKIKFLRIYISQDEFGNIYYGLNESGEEADKNQKDYYFKEGKFQNNNEFLEKFTYGRMATQNYSIDIKNKNLILKTKVFNFDNELIEGKTLYMKLFLTSYGIICIDIDVKPFNDSNSGNYCGLFIADNLDDEIISSYPDYVKQEFYNLNNQ